MDFGGTALGGLALDALVGALSTAKGADASIRYQEVAPELRRRLRPTAEQLAATLAERLGKAGISDPEQASIAGLLRRPEGRTLLRQTMLALLTEHEEEYRTDLQGQLLALLILITDLPRRRGELAASIVWAVIRDTFSRLLELAQESIEGALIVRSEAWEQFVLQDLERISYVTGRYNSYSRDEVHTFEEFQRMYRAAVHARHRAITPPHHYLSRAVPISKLFVAPRLRGDGATSGYSVTTGQLPKAVRDARQGERIQLKDLKERSHRTIVLGDPGGGKSTLALKLVNELSAPTRSERPCPIVVILRDYAQWESSAGGSILEYIEFRAKSHYQVSPPAGAVEFLLLSGRAFVFFDGLDELLDTTRREEIVANVSSFSDQYCAASILATSRRVGYHEAPLDSAIFEEIQLDEFDDSAVEEYVSKWFALDASRNPDEREKLVRSFLAESAEVKDIRSNPLLLALLCNVYRVENYIPSSRGEVYHSCATMLFEKWDSRRGIRVDLPHRRHLEPAIKYLAHWIYSDEGLQSGITETDLINKTIGYLRPDRIEDFDEARQVADEFVSFCKGRAWIFTDTGSTATGVSLYQFTHRTFLEYFTAGYLVRISPTAADLWRHLAPRIRRQEWDVVAQLSLQMKDEQGEDAAATFLTLLLTDCQRRNGSEAQNLLSFALRCLNIVAPGQRIVRDVVTISIDFIISSFETYDNTWAVVTSAKEPLQKLLLIRSENRSMAIRAAIGRFSSIIQAASANNTSQTVKAALLGLVIAQQPSMPNTSVHDDWREVGQTIREVIGESTYGLAAQSIELASILHVQGYLSTQEFITLHGLDGMFVPAGVAVTGPPAVMPSSAAAVACWLRFGEVEGWKDAFSFDYETAARTLAVEARRTLPHKTLSAKRIGLAIESNITSLYIMQNKREGGAAGAQSSDWQQLDGDLLFAGFVILAVAAEAGTRSTIGARVDDLGSLAELGELMGPRLHGVDELMEPSLVERDVESVSVIERQEKEIAWGEDDWTLIRAWRTLKFSFTDDSGSARSE